MNIRILKTILSAGIWGWALIVTFCFLYPMLDTNTEALQFMERHPWLTREDIAYLLPLILSLLLLLILLPKKNFFKRNSKNPAIFATLLLCSAIMCITAIYAGTVLKTDIMRMLSVFIQEICFVALSEELFFRVLLMEIWEGYEKIAMILSAGIFSGMHVFATLENPYLLFSIVLWFFLGLLLGWCYHKTKRILEIVFIHATYNIIVILLL